MARKQKQSSSDNPRQEGRLRAALNVVTTAFSCLVLLGMVMGLIVGREAMLREASRLRSMPVKVQFDWPPLAVPPGGVNRQSLDGAPNTWLDVKSRRSLEQIVLDHVSEDPFDADALRIAQKVLMETGWFDHRCTLSRDAAGIIHVTGEWREPVAAVRFGETDYVVASRGERLPAQYRPDESGLKVVIGPQKSPPGLGEEWIGGDVQAGLALLEFLRSMPYANQVAAIDISEYAARKRLLIITDRGSTIVWGGEPGHFHPGQARDDSKRGRLLRLFRESGRIDNGQDVLNVSLSSGY